MFYILLYSNLGNVTRYDISLKLAVFQVSISV